MSAATNARIFGSPLAPSGAAQTVFLVIAVPLIGLPCIVTLPPSGLRASGAAVFFEALAKISFLSISKW